MKSSFALLFLLFFVSSLLGQEDSIPVRGTIRLSKRKDTVYVLARMRFDVFQPTDDEIGKSYGDFVKSVKNMQAIKAAEAMEPCPKVDGFTAPFDYTRYFNSKIDVKSLGIYADYDTVEIRIDVRNNGKFYYKHLSQLARIDNQVMVYDARKNAYGPSPVHNSTMAALKAIKEWQPAYQMVPRQSKFKGTTVIKPEMEKLHATGVLTVIFSSEPIVK